MDLNNVRETILERKNYVEFLKEGFDMIIQIGNYFSLYLLSKDFMLCCISVLIVNN